MSFLDTIVKVGTSLLGGGKSGGGSLLGDLAKTAMLVYTTKKVNDSINRENAVKTNARGGSDSGGSDSGGSPAQVDPGVRLQVDPDPSHKIPVVYGQTHLGGILTDASLNPSNSKELNLVFTICEVTGTKLSDSAASVFSFEEIYINDQRVVFQTDTVTVDYTVDREGNVDRSLAGLCNIYCFNNGSTNPVYPTGLSGPALSAATSIVPAWLAGPQSMSGLVFAVVRLTYDSDKGITSIPTMMFKIKNTMTLPGDCVLDYMTNTRYGAGIPQAEIYVS
jgi:hypothetical protein